MHLCFKVSKRQRKCHVDCVSESCKIRRKGKCVSVRELHSDWSFSTPAVSRSVTWRGCDPWIENRLCIRLLKKKQCFEFMYRKVGQEDAESIIAVRLSLSLSLFLSLSLSHTHTHTHKHHEFRLKELIL